MIHHSLARNASQRAIYLAYFLVCDKEVGDMKRRCKKEKKRNKEKRPKAYESVCVSVGCARHINPSPLSDDEDHHGDELN